MNTQMYNIYLAISSYFRLLIKFLVAPRDNVI